VNDWTALFSHLDTVWAALTKEGSSIPELLLAFTLRVLPD
jgi:hypothetical protein